MAQISLQTAKKVVPMIYAYTTPEIDRHDGWIKIGYTEKGVDKRMAQQTHTADVLACEAWRGNAIYEDGSGERFSDTDFHAYLTKLGFNRRQGTEWFQVSGDESEKYFLKFRKNRGILKQLDAVVPYTLRAEQDDAVTGTINYYRRHKQGEYLWNAKPRFGKTLSVYDFCKRVDAKSVLIVTNRPAIANSWYSDYEHFLGQESGYRFVSATASLQKKKYVLSHEEYLQALSDPGKNVKGCIEFVSLQDLKGSIYFGGNFDKLKEVRHMDWDVLVIDEAHEGVDTYKTDVAFEHIKRKFTLHLSGTPFKALANDKFSQDAIFNWTYADEQKAKRDFDETTGDENPYATLPRLSLLTYQMSEIIRDELEQGIEIRGETVEYAFDLNEFFETKNGVFVHESAVDRFIDALTTQTKFPFSSEALRAELKHTFWLLSRVESAKALKKKLEAHPVFGQYKIIMAAGDGRMNEDDEIEKAFDRVKEAIRTYERTITLSVGQLTTGITVPEWSAVLMLSNLKSPALYMQAAFRAQNPCLFQNGIQYYRKENAYVFDFDPARTLIVFEQFANDLSEKTSDGRGDSSTRKENIRELLNFFPVIGEDDQGEMIELDAEKVLTIPRKIRSLEVVRRGFMSDYLFQNISNIFHAPMAVMDILKQLPAVQEPQDVPTLTTDIGEGLSLDENGNVSLSDDWVIGRTADVFGEKQYENIGEKLRAEVDKIKPETDDALEKMKEAFHLHAVEPLVGRAHNEYTGDLKASDQKRLDRKLTEEGNRIIGRAYGDFSIKQKTLEQERKAKLKQCGPAEVAKINKKFDALQQKAAEEFNKAIKEAGDRFAETAAKEIVRTVETAKKEAEKARFEACIRDHLRGFSRTIPSFLMAYGSEKVTLESFDTIIPDKVFVDVTSITLEQFRFLRDGGPYTDPETGEKNTFGGRLFDPVVFNDSVQEFMRLRIKLADYLDATKTEDIFDYIPPQRTNQIFTPKWVVQKMVDMLEQENPGCYDDPDKTFADLYMKSGMYITEIVKRLHKSEKMKGLFPDDKQRLQHIFANQVYGLAPTEIIYRIAIAYILGFAEDAGIIKHNFRMLDALPYAKDGTLDRKLNELFGKQSKKRSTPKRRAIR